MQHADSPGKCEDVQWRVKDALLLGLENLSRFKRSLEFGNIKLPWISNPPRMRLNHQMKVVLSRGVGRSANAPIFPARGLLRLSPARPEANNKLPHHVASPHLGFQWSDTWERVLG